MSYTNLRSLQPTTPETITPEQVGMDGGYRGDLPSRVAPLDSAAELDAVRFERGAVRKDFGYRKIGITGGPKVLGLTEHKFISGGITFHRLVRLREAGTGVLALEVWDGAAWVAVDETIEQVEDVLLSTVSIQGRLLIADGEYIWSWTEEPEILPAANDFPAGNLLDAEGETVDVTVTPAGAVENSYDIFYDVRAHGASTGGVTIILGFEKNGVEFSERVYVSAASSDPGFLQEWLEESILAHTLEDGDVLTIRLKTIDSEGAGAQHLEMIAGGSGFELFATKNTAPQAADDTYHFTYRLNVSTEFQASQDYFTDVEFWADIDGLSGYVLIYTIRIYVLTGESTVLNSLEHSIIVDGMVNGGKFKVTTGATNADQNVLHSGEIDWNDAVDASADVHGYNLAVDADTHSGVEYTVEGATISTLAIISPDAPAGRIVGNFADRAIALRDGGDGQSFAWSVSGDITDWIGVGSGQIFLINSRSDAIDDLTGFATVGSNVGALFRKRSINRVFPTGNVLQAIGVVEWIDSIGTESPFSIQNVEGGVMFLGHNMMPYILSEGGIRQIGIPIHQELIETVTSRLDGVDSAYDPVFNEYILGVPEGGADHITKLWFFDVRKFIDSGELVWRSREVDIQRISTVSQVL